MSDAFAEALLRRALEDQPIRDTQQLKAWFADYVDLFDDELQSTISELAATDPRNANSGGRKKSVVYTMLQVPNAGTKRGSTSGSAAKRAMLAGSEKKPRRRPELWP